MAQTDLGEKYAVLLQEQEQHYERALDDLVSVSEAEKQAAYERGRRESTAALDDAQGLVVLLKADKALQERRIDKFRDLLSRKGRLFTRASFSPSGESVARLTLYSDLGEQRYYGWADEADVTLEEDEYKDRAFTSSTVGSGLEKFLSEVQTHFDHADIPFGDTERRSALLHYRQRTSGD